MPNLICGKAAVGGNYNSTHDTIHGSVNVDPVRLLFCGNLTILLLGRIIYYLFKTAPQPSQAIAQRFSSIRIYSFNSASISSMVGILPLNSSGISFDNS